MYHNSFPTQSAYNWHNKLTVKQVQCCALITLTQNFAVGLKLPLLSASSANTF